MASSRKIHFTAGALALATMLPAAGQTATDDAWHYEAIPYLWAAGIDGTTRVGPLSADSSSSFSDLLKSVDFAVAGAFEARRGRWAIVFDGSYIKVSTDAAIPQGTVNVKVTQQMYSLGGAWRAVEGPVPVDLLAGGRYNYVRPRLALGGAVNERSAHALDPFVGVRAQYPLGERWTLIGYLDAGTFDGDDYAFQVLAGASYAWAPDRAFKFGYRRLQTKFTKDALEIDTTMQGLYVGVGLRF